MAVVNWAKVMIWIVIIGAFFYVLKEVRSKWVWAIIFIFFGGLAFIKFMQWVWEHEGVY